MDEAQEIKDLQAAAIKTTRKFFNEFSEKWNGQRFNFLPGEIKDLKLGQDELAVLVNRLDILIQNFEQASVKMAAGREKVEQEEKEE